MIQDAAILKAQESIPGVEPGGRFIQLPLVAVVGAPIAHSPALNNESSFDESFDGPAAVSPGQLSFGPNQMVLEESPSVPVQLSLLPDPPVWEADPPAPPALLPPGRLARRRRRASITPGQTSLF